MKTNSKTKSFSPKMNFTKSNNSIAATLNAIIITAGAITSIILFLIKISWIDINWKIPLIPLMIALQVIFLLSAIKNRYKKL